MGLLKTILNYDCKYSVVGQLENFIGGYRGPIN